MNGSLKVCFVVPGAYVYFDESVPWPPGGAERQAYLLGNALADDPGFEIHFCVADFGQPLREMHGVVDVWKSYRYGDSVLRSLIRLSAALRAIEADVYIFRSASVGVAMGIVLARWICRRPVVYMLANDDEVRPMSLIRLLGWPRAICMGAAYRMSNEICAQSGGQKAAFRLYRKIKCVSVVPNLCDTRPSVAEPKRRRTVILWVGRADPWKRGEAFVELARRFPDRSFVMVCSVTENRVYGDALVAMAERVPNLELHMGLKTEALLPLYDVSELLVNTSYSEGVSNAMLEAMSAGCAILSSMTNPDNVLTREGVGWCADSLDDDSLAALFAQVSANAEILSAAGKRASEYVRCNHGRDVVATAFAAVVTSASKKRRRSRCLKFAAKGR